MEKKLGDSELIVNPDGSIYHIKLREEHVADNVIVVGDPNRVKLVSSFFNKVEHTIENREFYTHTGEYKGKRVTVLSTGIGTDNIDIVVNELDAAVNIDLRNRTVKPDKRKLNIIRIGTSGALQEDIPVDSFLLSEYGLGFDGVLHFYDYSKDVFQQQFEEAFVQHTAWHPDLAKPYIFKSGEALFNKLKSEQVNTGITATANGFYGPQGRELRLKIKSNDLNRKLISFRFRGMRITNFEMETSALYGLSSLLGHNSVTVCAIIANRLRQEYSKDYKQTVRELIEYVLEKI
ncbi:MAG: phosphorylase [Bacteroidetes bacterium]|nr:MAG: phosphorylase [Bacteroidota bacterium]